MGLCLQLSFAVYPPPGSRTESTKIVQTSRVIYLKIGELMLSHHRTHKGAIRAILIALSGSYSFAGVATWGHVPDVNNGLPFL